MFEWLSKDGGYRLKNDWKRKNSDKTPELKKIKFKKEKNIQVLPKRGKMGDNIVKITAYYESLGNQSKFGKIVTSNVGRGGEGSSGLGKGVGATKNSGGVRGEGGSSLGKGLGVANTVEVGVASYLGAKFKD